MITRTCSRAPSSEEYYSTFDDTPLSPLPSEYEDDNAVTDDELAPPLEIISIGLNLKSTSNKKKPFPSDREERIVFTAAEMEKAENAEDLNNWSDFCHRVRCFLLCPALISDLPSLFFSWVPFTPTAIRQMVPI
jgi:hypothetical protein